jgi:hypothetical protein
MHLEHTSAFGILHPRGYKMLKYLRTEFWRDWIFHTDIPSISPAGTTKRHKTSTRQIKIPILIVGSTAFRTYHKDGFDSNHILPRFSAALSLLGVLFSKFTPLRDLIVFYPAEDSSH